MSFPLFVVRWIIRCLTFPQRRRFEDAIDNPKKHQDRVLSKILNLTEMSRLPEQPTEYKDYPENVSWSIEAVRFYETTSGNSGKKKAIPYTASLLNSFQTLFLLWIDDVLTFQKLSTGKIFISISPKLESLGMNSDLEYLHPFLQRLIKRFLTVPPSEFTAYNGHEFLKKVAVYLLNDSQLECISVWSPSYLISLLEFVDQHDRELCAHISPSTYEKVRRQDWMAIWPLLKIISCWTDGSSQVSAQKLRQIFPGVIVQGKGLLSTEAPITIPWTQSGGCLPLWTEVYLEFIDEKGVINPVSSMKVGQEGELLVSTQGGLLRYRLGDLVRCTHFFRSSPVLKFLRRQGEVSDLVGEKLDSNILTDVFSDLPRGMWFLVAHHDHYVFVSNFEVSPEEIDRRLKQSFHYGLARELQQLKLVQTIYEPDLGRKMMIYYADRKIRLGDIKERLLWADPQILRFLESSKLPDSYL